MIVSRNFIACAAFALLATSAVGFAEEATQPDNTQINQRDRNAGELSASDQGNSKEDIALTQKIRQTVVKQKSFSTDAKNIKIISLNGQVTLKGPVKSDKEKKEIEKIATRVAGASKVTSQIDVEQK